MNVSDVTRAVGQYMEIHGKAEGVASTADGRVCAIGAVCAVTSKLEGSMTYADKTRLDDKIFLSLYEKAKADGFPSIPVWSDSHDQAYVVKSFYEIADQAAFDE